MDTTSTATHRAWHRRNRGTFDRLREPSVPTYSRHPETVECRTCQQTNTLTCDTAVAARRRGVVGTTQYELTHSAQTTDAAPELLAACSASCLTTRRG